MTDNMTPISEFERELVAFRRQYDLSAEQREWIYLHCHGAPELKKLLRGTVRKKTAAKREVDLCLEGHLLEIFGTNPVREVLVCAHRKWKFDYALPHLKLAIEIEGGVWNFGRHVRGKGVEGDLKKSKPGGDLEKYNTATDEGWHLYRFTTDQIRFGRDIPHLLAFRRICSRTVTVL